MPDASFPELLRLHRRRAGLTQEQLALRAGLGVRTLRDLERGKVRRPHRESVRLLAQALALSGEPRARFLSAAAALAAGDGPQGGAPPVPAQLPPDVADFTGRDALGGELLALLTRREAPTAVVVSAVAGRAGVGKTALAVHVAQQARAAFPDGQLYVNLRGAQAQALDPSAVLARFLQALGIEPSRVPAEPEERATLFRSLLADRRVLVVLDNAASEAQVRPLLPAGPGCAVLVTSRRRLTGLEGARRLDLDVLDEAEALTLLGRVAGPDRLGDDPGAAATVVAACGRLPLAVRIAGAKLAARPEWTVGDLAARLADERRRLDELRAGDLEVRGSAALSYRTLSAGARRAFRLLGLLDTPDFAAWVAAALLDADLDRAQVLVDDLVDAQLLDETSSDATGTLRYRFHDLMRVYARELAQQDDDTDAALSRALSGWLSLAAEGERRLPDTPTSVHPPGPRPWSAPAGLAERLLDAPLSWFQAEQQALIDAIEQACRARMVTPAWELAAHLIPWFALRSQWEPWRHTHEIALDACRGAGDRKGEATMLLGLGALSSHVSDEAPAYYQRALDLFREAGDGRGEARALSELSTALHGMMRFGDALRAADDALVLSRRHQLVGVETDALLSRAQALLDLGRVEEALVANTQSLLLLRGSGARRMEAQALSQLARARRAAGDLVVAAGLLEESLHIARDLGDEFGEAYLLVEYAEVQALLERNDEAELALAASRDLCQAISAPSLEAFGAFTLGNLRRAQGRLAEAGACFARAAELWDAVGNVGRAATARAAAAAVAQPPGPDASA